jgi:hypothetical protein
MDNNVYTNKELYSYHYGLEHTKRRLDDFNKIYEVLKNNLEPKSKARINQEKIREYIDLYKHENTEFIKKVLNHIYHIDYNKFCSDSFEQVEVLNNNLKGKKYIYILGVNNQSGSSSNDFNIYKSNLWMFMLIYDKLIQKPIDILLNMKIAIQLYGDTVEYLLVDDCSYSGSQMIDQVLYADSSETLYKYPNSYLIKSDVYRKTIFKPVKNHNIKINLFIPYLSFIAWNKIQELKLITCLNVITYEKYILNEYGALLSREDSNKLQQFYSNFYNYINPLTLIPIFFDHKIADAISTIDLILTKGQVLDNSDLRLIFVEPCDELYSKYPANELLPKMLYCPKPPYHYFLDILKEKLK